MKAVIQNSATRIPLTFPVLLTLTAIVCLAAIQFLGVDSSLPIATACAVLVFCARPTLPSTWEMLMNVFLMRSARSAK